MFITYIFNDKNCHKKLLYFYFHHKIFIIIGVLHITADGQGQFLLFIARRRRSATAESAGGAAACAAAGEVEGCVAQAHAEGPQRLARVVLVGAAGRLGHVVVRHRLRDNATWLFL